MPTASDDPMTVIALPARVSMPEARDVLAQARGGLQGGGPLVLDASAVEEVTAAGAQVLVGIAKAAATTPGFQVVRPSMAYSAAIADLGLEAVLAADGRGGEPPARAASPENTATARGAADERMAMTRPLSAAAPSKAVRVALDRIDRLSDIGAHIAVTQAGLMQQIDPALRDSHPDLVSGLEALAPQTRALQDAVMAVRAQPVKTLFSRLPRVARRLATATGKAVRLQTEGEAVEIDAAQIDTLAEALALVIRDAIEHSLEAPAARAAAGKPEQGVITLRAEPASGRVLIHVVDDGAGLDRADDAAPVDGAPSSAGPEAVRDGLERLGGRLSVRTCPGEGAHVTLSLPQSVAVLDVVALAAAGQRYVLPAACVMDTMSLADARLGRLPTGETLARFRGVFVEVVDLAALSPGSGETSRERVVAFCAVEGERRLGLIVDAVLGRQRVAIKGLEARPERAEGVGGATMLDDGRVALLLDLIALDRVAQRRGLKVCAA